MREIMITGGMGFIGSNLVKHWRKKYPDDKITIVDSLTYASREYYVADEEFEFCYLDISKADEVRKAIRVLRPDHIIHLAAESHVCRSIDGPKDFIHTNIVGTFNLLEAFKDLNNGGRFHHVSTDEVYGELCFDEREKFHELRKYAPRSPYAASKAASDHLVQAWHHTYNLATIITNCSNNFGPNQHEEKLVPKAILSCLKDEPMTIYGTGTQVRDWIHVKDHCEAIDVAFHKGFPGHTYCIGGNVEMTNMQMIGKIQLAASIIKGKRCELKLIRTNDRPTDDLRYAVDTGKINKLGWSANINDFSSHLLETVQWYKDRL